MPEGESPFKPLGPSPVTHKEDGTLRRRDEPHGLNRRDRGWLAFDRGAQRFGAFVDRLIEPKGTVPQQPEPAPTASVTTETYPDAIETTAREIHPEPQLIQQPAVESPPAPTVQPEDEILRFGADLPPHTVRFMRFANWLGDFFQRNVATPLLGEPSNAPLQRRPEYEYTHQMRVQQGTSAPSSVRVVEPEKKPYDWKEDGDNPSR